MITIKRGRCVGAGAKRACLLGRCIMDPWRSFRGTASSRAFTDRLTGCLEVNCTHIHTHTRTNRNETFSTHPDLNCIVYHHRDFSCFSKVMSTLGSIVMPIMMLIRYVCVCSCARALNSKHRSWSTEAE